MHYFLLGNKLQPPRKLIKNLKRRHLIQRPLLNNILQITLRTVLQDHNNIILRHKAIINSSSEDSINGIR